jgi:hypothetical protein
MRIPLDRRIAEAYSEGVSVVEALPGYREQFCDMYALIREFAADKKGLGAQ